MNKINFKKRLIIGTANFTQKYGADPNKIKRLEGKLADKLRNRGWRVINKVSWKQRKQK